MTPEQLTQPGTTFFVARDGEGRLRGVGGLRHVEPGHGEVKAMHTVREVRGKGVGRRLLREILDAARARGYRRVSLETGSMSAFAPARALYESVGFVECGPFGDYLPSSNSVFMSLALAAHK